MELLAISAMTGYSCYAMLTTPSIPIKAGGISPYNTFVKERYKEIKEISPDITNKEIFNIIAIEWKMLNEGFKDL